MVYQLESAQSRPFLDRNANWTATYRRDSTLVAPYGWWKSNNDDMEDDDDTDDSDNVVSADFAGVREGRVAWFVSNCDANNKRLEYAEQLAKHYPLDIFGKCGNLRCPRVSNCLIMGIVTCLLFYRENTLTAGRWLQKNTNFTLHLRTATV